MKKLYVGRSKIQGNGLFSETDIRKGELIDYIHGPTVVIKKFSPVISKKILNWIGTGRHSWIDTSNSIFRFINHSCTPNTFIKTKRGVYALTDIPQGTELTMDYSLTEAEFGWKIDNCQCGTHECRGTITSIYALPLPFVKKSKHIITKTFWKSYASFHNLSPD